MDWTLESLDPWILDLWTLGLVDPWTLVDPWALGPLDLWTLVDPWTCGSLGPWILDLWTLGPLELWTPGPLWTLGSWTLGLGPLSLDPCGPLDPWITSIAKELPTRRVVSSLARALYYGNELRFVMSPLDMSLPFLILLVRL